jgi:hypothetical protein
MLRLLPPVGWEARETAAKMADRDDATPELSIRPQPGPQERFLSSSADVVIYGGAAGGGKSFGLLLESLRNIENPEFGATIFRRTYPQITAQGGIWQESIKLFPQCGATANNSELKWTFASGATIQFRHLQHEATVREYDGSQIAFIGFDELIHFTEYQFVYMLSRNRSTCGVKPYIRATTNPDSSSWVKRWIEWWIDPETGYPIAERAGIVRWFVRDNDTLRWFESQASAIEAHPTLTPKSFTFIPATLADNKILEKKDPGYRANLQAMPRIERERLLGGNWNISNAEGEWPPEYFSKRIWFPEWPGERSFCTLAWDPSKGSDAKFGDYQSIAILVRDPKGGLYADAVMSRFSIEEGIDTFLDLVEIWEPDGVAIETNTFQFLIAKMLLARMRERMIFAKVFQINNNVSKDVRIRRLGVLLMNQLLRLRGDSSGARLLCEQLQQFPNGDHDDGPDSLEMAHRLMVKLFAENVKRKKQKIGAGR